MSDKPLMNAAGESDDCIVPAKDLNKDGQPTAESPEGRRSIKENSVQTHTSRTQSREIVSQGLFGVRDAAKKDKELRFTALLHHVTQQQLRDSFDALQRQAAPGVDQITWRLYEPRLEERIPVLHERIHRGTYRAQPSRRIYLTKPDGRQRPIGIAALEDKIVQRTVGTILNQIYDEDFVGFSYGFRPGKSAHDALDALSTAIVRKKVNWIVDADIRGFFDNLDHGWMMQFIERRVRDRRILRLIQKWLKAGVSEQGEWSETKVGTPQGAVISPLLANIYLHYVFDLWVQQWRKETARGEVIVVRYADDFVLGFQYRDEAVRFVRELQQRLKQFGLELHPDKTRLIQFGRFAVEQRQREGCGKPETFDFLGFTHICGTNHKTGRFTVKRKSIRKRGVGKLKAIKEQLRRRMHESIAELGQWLGPVVRGYYNYHAIPGNFPWLQTFRQEVLRRWWRTLLRRSQRKRLLWKRFVRIGGCYLPTPVIVHPYPLQRFCARHPR